MTDDLDRLFAAARTAPPEGFAERIAAQARELPQRPPPAPITLLESLSLAASAACGALVAGEFIFFAFVAASAH